MATATKSEPKFIEANLHALQIHSAGTWLDYSSIKTPLDMKLAIQNVKSGEGRMRIVECKMGTLVVFTNPLSYEYGMM